MSSSTIKQLNDCKQLPFLKLKDLKEEIKYEMENMGVITTKFGECVLVKLKEYENQLLLPKRFQKLIPNIEKINQDIANNKVQVFNFRKNRGVFKCNI